MTRYISLAEYLWLAEQVTVTPAETLAKSSRLDLRGLGTPRAVRRIRRRRLLSRPYDKAAVMTCPLAWNHPLMDGNKHAAWAALIMFIDLNSGHWNPDPPNVDDAEAAMVTVASHKLNESEFADWLRVRVEFNR